MGKEAEDRRRGIDRVRWTEADRATGTIKTTEAQVGSVVYAPDYRSQPTIGQGIPKEVLLDLLAAKTAREACPECQGSGVKREGPDDPLKPSVAILAKLGTVLALAADCGLTDLQGHKARTTIASIVADPDVQFWLGQMDGLALIPKNRG